MTIAQHILVPVDFSEPSERALATAVDLARAFDARITLMHAWSIPAAAYAEGVSWPIYDIEGAAKQALDDTFEKLSSTYPKTEALLRQGDGCQQILETAKERRCDLVVMGTHGRRGLTRALLGSVAEKVIRLSPVPVVTVGRPNGEGAGAARRGIARVLVPTDFSAEAARALDAAIDVARTFDARLTLLHVWSMPYTAYSEGLNWPIAEMEQSAHLALDGLLAETVKRYPRTDAILRLGTGGPEIVDVTRERAIDLVVMGTHGRKGLPRLLIGSVAATVVRLSPVPVMTVGGTREK
ncbi:MAG: universal stress protein [Labilithrix sp.]|nr:universal stress protein [Labilithrix sp.]